VALYAPPMPTAPTLFLFVLASYALAVVPGPAVVYIVNRSLAQGRRVGVYSALGIATGGLAHVLAAAVGLSAILTASALAFSIVKYAGAGYLVYLGVRALRSGEVPLEAAATEVSQRRAFGQGIVVNVLNPKTGLFFLSFFPQFIHPEVGPVAIQMVILGSVFIAAALSSDLIYALAAGWIRRLLVRSGRARTAHRYVTAAVFVGLGATSALSK
jgi:threonine/homoserine/homoserine lactone efflux protein